MSYILTINSITPPPSITTVSLPDICKWSTYNQTVTAINGTPPFIWSIDSGTLPTSLTLNPSTGDITGLASDNSGVYNFIVKVVDANLSQDTKSLSITILDSPVIAINSPLPPGNDNVPYSFTIPILGGVGPFIWSVSTGTLPTGLTLHAGSGLIDGTPTVIGLSTFDITVTGSNGCADVLTFDLDIRTGIPIFPGFPPNVTGLFPPACRLDSYFYQVLGSGGTAPYTFSLVSGSLPSGVLFDSKTGIFQGKVANYGTFNFTLQITDSVLSSSTHNFSITIYDTPTITTNATPPGAYGKLYSFTLNSVGGTQPLTWFIEGISPLPPGLSLHPLFGSIVGTPLVTGNYKFTIGLQASIGCRDTKDFNISIAGAPIFPPNPDGSPSITGVLDSACQNSAYSRFIQVHDGTPPYYYFVDSSSFLPAGLILNPFTGEIAGIPVVAGTFSIKINVSDQNNLTASKTYKLIVVPEAECQSTIESQTIVRARLASLESIPVVVQDPFHQQHISEYLPPNMTE